MPAADSAVASPRPLRWAGWLLLTSLMIGAFEPHFVRIFFSDLGNLRSETIRYPDAAVPMYPYFLRQVRARTEPGSSVALVVPWSKWDGGYAFCYYRASYFLAGRRVIPLVAPDDSLHPEKLMDADYVAVWRMGFRSAEFAPVWQGLEGRLERRIR